MAKSRKLKNKRKITRRRGGMFRTQPQPQSTMNPMRATSPSPKRMSSVTIPTRPTREELESMSHEAQPRAFEHGLEYLKYMYINHNDGDMVYRGTFNQNSKPECFNTLVYTFTNCNRNTVVVNNPKGLTKKEMIELIRKVFNNPSGLMQHNMLHRLTEELDKLLENGISCWEFWVGGRLPGVCRLWAAEYEKQRFDALVAAQRASEASELVKKNQ